MEKHKWMKNGIRICPTASYLDRRSNQARRRNSAEQLNLETQLSKLQATEDEVVRNLNRTSYNLRNQLTNTNTFCPSEPTMNGKRSPKFKRASTPMPTCISDKLYFKRETTRSTTSNTQLLEVVKHKELRRHSEGDIQSSIASFQAEFRTSKRGLCVLPAINQGSLIRAASANVLRKRSLTESDGAARMRDGLSRISPCLSSSECIDIEKDTPSENESNSEDELLLDNREYSKTLSNPPPTPTPSILVSCAGEVVETLSNVNRRTPSPLLLRRNGWSSTIDLSDDHDGTSSVGGDSEYSPYVGNSKQLLTEWRIHKPLREARKNTNSLTPASFSKLSQQRRGSAGEQQTLLNTMFNTERRKSDVQLRSKIDEFLKKSCVISD